MDWPVVGAFAFGVLLGWYVYYINRYRKGEIQIGDIVTLVGAIGGGAVLALFNEKNQLFGAYGVGLAVGFFAYFSVLLVLVRISSNFDFDWFLDGRRKNPADGWGYGQDQRPTVTPMAVQPTPQTVMHFHGVNPGEAQELMALRSTGPALAAPNRDSARIQSTCVEVWSQSGPQGPFKSASSSYVIEVAQRLGLKLSGTADQIIDETGEVTTWTTLATGAEARDAAMQGKFVLAGVKSDAYDPPRTEGRLAIVMPGEMNLGGWAPAGYWGSTDPDIAKLGGAGSPISLCFTAAVKDDIVYRCRAI
jgi:hypothetical protein